MKSEHVLHPGLSRDQPIQILVAGAGGNGSAIALWLPFLHQAMQVWGFRHGLHVTLADGDVVTETNCVRQPFSASDIGLNKAIVLINRINLFYGRTWSAHPKHLRKDSLKSKTPPHIVIGCVDTRKARQQILQLVSGPNKNTVYWLDLGNNADSGQYVLGQPLNSVNRRNATRLRTVAELYPEIADPRVGEDPLPSCSALEALERQQPYVNQALASSALSMLARLFHYGRLKYHGAFFNATTGRMSALPVDAALWRKTRPSARKSLPAVG